MLVIRRTDTGGLRVSDGRRTDTAATEEHARRVVTAWGYGNFSFNKALILMKESEGSIAPVANPWLARRGTEPAPAAPHAEPKPEPAASSTLKEPPTMNVPARSRRPRAAGVPTPEETTAAPASPVVTADAPVAETAVRPRRARKARPADAEPSAESAGAAPEPAAETPVAEAADPEKAASGTRPRRARKPDVAVAEPAAEAPQGAAEPSVAETATAPDRETAPVRRRGRRPKAEPSGAADVQPAAPAGAVPVAEPVSGPVAEAPAQASPAVPAESGADAAPRPSRPRAPRRAAAEEAPARPAAESVAPAAADAGAPAPKAERARSAARTPEEWLEAARALFAEGTQALREIESATLPFARGPWTELRTQSAEILACLQGKKPDRS